MNKVILKFIMERLMKLVSNYGIQVVIQALIEITNGSDESHMRALSKDLKVALSNYKKNKGK